jgi:hypothetical protein
MLDTMKIAEAVKDYLIDLAINDRLPLDMTEISEYGIEEAIKSALPTKRDEIIAKASELLAYDSEISTEEMIKRIVKCKDENEIIDYIDGVDVWEKVEYSFTCEQFLEQIGYDEKAFKKKPKKK